MKEFTCTVSDPCGLHARPAGRLTALAKQFSSSITVRMGGKEADAKRLISLMSLGASQGAELHFKAEGADEDAAMRALQAFFSSEKPEAERHDG